MPLLLPVMRRLNGVWDVCHIVLQLLMLYRVTHICLCAYDGIWGIGGVASHIFHLSTSVLILAYRHLGQQF